MPSKSAISSQIIISKIFECPNGQLDVAVEYEDQFKREENQPHRRAASAGSDEDDAIALQIMREACQAGDEDDAATERGMASNEKLGNCLKFINSYLPFNGRSESLRLYCSFSLLFFASLILITCSVVNILIMCKLRFLKCQLTFPWKFYTSPL